MPTDTLTLNKDGVKVLIDNNPGYVSRSDLDTLLGNMQSYPASMRTNDGHDIFYSLETPERLVQYIQNGELGNYALNTDLTMELMGMNQHKSALLAIPDSKLLREHVSHNENGSLYLYPRTPFSRNLSAVVFAFDYRSADDLEAASISRRSVGPEWIIPADAIKYPGILSIMMPHNEAMDSARCPPAQYRAMGAAEKVVRDYFSLMR